METGVHIVGIGARTPLGFGVAPSAAALQSGISSVAEHPFMVNCVGDRMLCSRDLFVDPELSGPKRFLMLAASALREACLPLAERSTIQRYRTRLYLGLPELRPGFSDSDIERIRRGLIEDASLPVEFADLHVASAGHASGLSALATAAGEIHRGEIEACLVGGVDSYLHPDTMEWLDESRQIISVRSRSGFVPGEGAAFCLLAGESFMRRLRLRSYLRVRAVAVDRETKLIKTEDVCLGEGLTAAIRKALSVLALPSETVRDVICDINGERYRGEEWGLVSLRLPHYFADPTSYLSPADSWGDAGAASGPLFLVLAGRHAEKSDTGPARTLVWASSEGGLRGAAVLETPTPSDR